jgi:serine/threonine-protein kinase
MSASQGSIPTQIGRFRIDALIGRGGMGAVYKAFDPALQRVVAIKTVRPDIDNPESLERLYREAQATARLQHPNIVTVFEAGEWEGMVYIAMEYLKGADLASVLRRGDLTFEARMRILQQVLDALQHAHVEGVIHRDIKPSNVQVLPDGSIKLMDFGLARIVTAESLTVSGAVMGTPHYASPEQLRGQDVDRRTDIYSTGVLAYEMLSGRRPFQGDNDSIATVVLKVISEPPPPLNVFWSQQLPEVESIITRAMAKTPDERYQSAEDMRATLASFVDHSRAAISAAQTHIDESNAAGRPESAATLRLNQPPSAPTMTPPPKAPPAPQTLPPAAAPIATRSRPAWIYGAAAAAVLVVVAVVVMTRSSATPTSAGPPAQAPSPAAALSNPAPPAPPAPTSAATGVASSAAPSANPTPVPAARPANVAERRSAPAPPAADASPASPEAPIASAGAKQLFHRAAIGAADASKVNAGLRYRIVQQQRDGSELDVDPATKFRAGDRVRFSFESNIAGHLYVVQQGSSGRWTVLFPNPDINGGRNAIKPFERYDVPRDAWFKFDETPGTEQVFLFLSREPVTQLPGFDRPVTRMESVQASVVEDLRRSIRSRDLMLEKDTTASAGSKSGQATYVVNREEVGKAVSAVVELTHVP